MRKQRGFRFPVVVHLQEAVGALTLHTGVGTQIYYMTGHKKCPRTGEPTRLLEMYYTTKVRKVFQLSKETPEIFSGELKHFVLLLF